MYKITINRFSGLQDTHTSLDMDGCLYYLRGYTGIKGDVAAYDNTEIKSIHIEEVNVSESTDEGII